MYVKSKLRKEEIGLYSKFEALLKEKGVSTYEVAKETGIATATFTNWKQGAYKPKMEKMLLLAKYFDVPVTYFYEDAEEE